MVSASKIYSFDILHYSSLSYYMSQFTFSLIFNIGFFILMLVIGMGFITKEYLNDYMSRICIGSRNITCYIVFIFFLGFIPMMGQGEMLL